MKANKNAVDVLLAVASLVTANAIAAQDLPYRGEGQVMVTPSDLEWKPVASMTEGATMAVIEGNPSQAGPFTFRLALPADYELAPHTHPAYERLTVLSGSLFFGHGRELDRAAARELTPGSVAIMAPGEPMFGYTEQPTVIQLHGEGPWGIEYLDPADDPRR